MCQGAFDIEALRGPRFDPNAIDIVFILNTKIKVEIRLVDGRRILFKLTILLKLRL